MKDIDTHIVSLKFFNFDGSLDELTKELGLEPTRIAQKGQEYYIGPQHNRVKKTLPWNFWEYQEVMKQNDHWTGDQINAYIEKIIEPRPEIIKNIIAKCQSEFSIVQYLYKGGNPRLHINNEKLLILAQIGTAIDIDFYVLGDEPDLRNKKDSIK